ncbi:conserved hypothetical protein, partial [Ricinus communis]
MAPATRCNLQRLYGHRVAADVRAGVERAAGHQRYGRDSARAQRRRTADAVVAARTDKRAHPGCARKRRCLSRSDDQRRIDEANCALR